MDEIPPAIIKPEIKYTKLFINNEYVDAKAGTVFPTEDPTTGQEICRVAEAKEADVNAAVATARAAFNPGSEWRKMAASKRGILLNKLASFIDRDTHYLASLESWDGGKIYTACYAFEIPHCAEVLRYFAGWCDKDHGKTIPWDNAHFAYTRHEPIGVCGAITPWNGPLAMFCWKLGPAIATGNTVVIKPSELTPLTALYMGSLIKEAGFPPGVVNIVPGYGHIAGSTLSHHMDVDKIAFTGSLATGRLILKAAADSNLKPVTLELGGKSPFIIFSDADVDEAVEMSHNAVFFNNGQVCIAASRAFVHEDIYDEFLEKSLNRAKMGKVGDPKDFNTEHGPQICKAQKEKILRLIKSGKEQGCKVLCGGGAVDKSAGYYVQPTVLTDLRDDMEISQEEVFGPVQQIYKFKDVAEVLPRANCTKYGLAAGIITKDINNAIKVANGVQAGVVWINCYGEFSGGTPFGGYKCSGIGRELGDEVLREYTQVKTVVVKLTET